MSNNAKVINEYKKNKHDLRRDQQDLREQWSLVRRSWRLPWRCMAVTWTFAERHMAGSTDGYCENLF